MSATRVVLLSLLCSAVVCAKNEKAPHTQAKLVIAGMVDQGTDVPQVKNALSAASGVKDVMVDWEKKTACVTYDPLKTNAEAIIGSLTKKKKKYTATLDKVETIVDTGIGTWVFSTEHASYSPEGKGKLELAFDPKGGSIKGVKVEWTPPTKLTLTPTDSESLAELTTAHTFSADFEVADDAKGPEMLVHALLTYTAKDAKGKESSERIELVGVVVLQK